MVESTVALQTLHHGDDDFLCVVARHRVWRSLRAGSSSHAHQIWSGLTRLPPPLSLLFDANEERMKRVSRRVVKANGRSLRFGVFLVVAAALSFYHILVVNQLSSSSSTHTRLARLASLPSSSSLNEPSVSDSLFIPYDEVETFYHSDEYSACWMQSVERFLQANLTAIEILEDAAFVPIHLSSNGAKDIRMTRDYLDFSVEHMSKWWRMGKVEKHAAKVLDDYSTRTLNNHKTFDTIMESTIALISFCVDDQSDTVTQDIWRAALKATIVSLLKHGVGRIVVVGHYAMDETLVSQVFSSLVGSFERNPSPGFQVQFRATELAFVRLNALDIDTGTDLTYSSINVPRGGLVGLQAALKGEMSVKETNKYLGSDPHRFKYVFMTESDQVLQARMTKRFLSTMDDNGILIPHRLQPMPHKEDVKRGFKFKFKHFPSQPAMWLDPATDSCCDVGNFHTGFEKRKCLAFWWMCGFKENGGDFAHLKDYHFFRLATGTGIVSLSGTAHSRRCLPQRHNRVCSTSPVNKAKE